MRGIVQATGDKGADVSVSVEGGAITDRRHPRHIAQAGELGWTVKLDTDKGVISVHRLDNGAGSRITIEKIDISGSWKGTLTFSEINLDPEAQKQAEELSEGAGVRPRHRHGRPQGKALPHDPQGREGDRAGEGHGDGVHRHVVDQGCEGQADQDEPSRPRRSRTPATGSCSTSSSRRVPRVRCPASSRRAATS